MFTFVHIQLPGEYMDAEIKKQFIEMRTQIEEIHAALFAGEVTLNRKPGRLALRLKAKKMLKA